MTRDAELLRARDLHAQARDLDAQSRQLRIERDRLILRAAESGVSQAQIARTVRCSPELVAKIIRGAAA